MLLVAPLMATVAFDPPVVVVDRDNVVITRSSIVEIRADVIRDTDGNGVIHVEADDVVIEFSPTHRELIGAEEGTDWDTIDGVGIRVRDRRNVTIRNAHAHRFKVGIHATACDGLVLERCDVAGGYAQRLGSTPEAEDGADWLWPHDNDDHEWMQRYGAGIYVEASSNVTVRDCFARRRQNGIVLDRVTDGRIYDNDCSFLSGWGLAMWRCERNVVSRNAFDFCVRGYSHGVYNRGQDSAGILLFEQNRDNVFSENSVTHGGDGIFAFAGREALGERDPREDLDWYRGRGNTGNVFYGNDLSYAAAHGLELTFSFDNEIVANRMVENAICGVWGGYSQNTLITGNTFEGNGEGAYGLERGGINIEHGHRNRIVGNTFRNNRCGIFLWWDADEGLMKTPWARANEKGSSDNLIVRNVFSGDLLAVQLRQTTGTVLAENTFANVETELDADEMSRASFVREAGGEQDPAPGTYPVLGESRPLGARKHLAGRNHIIITEWGPYDWDGPYLQRLADEAGAHVYRLLGRAGIKGARVDGRATLARRGDRDFLVQARAPGTLAEYRLEVTTADDEEVARTGAVLRTEWDVVVFEYERPTEPRTAPAAGARGLESAPVRFLLDRLDLPYGGGGPGDLAAAPAAVTEAGIGRDFFGTVATTSVRMPAGTWRIVTSSDDGIRVWMDEEILIDDWTWHPPKRNATTIEIGSERVVRFRVEHFELDGYALLSLAIEPAGR